MRALSVKGVELALLPGDKPLVFFAIAPWCSHCRTLFPVILDLDARNKSKSGVDSYDVAAFDASKHRGEIAESGLGRQEVGVPLSDLIQKYPTILLFDRRGGVRVHTGPRTADALDAAARAVAAGAA